MTCDYRFAVSSLSQPAGRQSVHPHGRLWQSVGNGEMEAARQIQRVSGLGRYQSVRISGLRGRQLCFLLLTNVSEALDQLILAASFPITLRMSSTSFPTMPLEIYLRVYHRPFLICFVFDSERRVFIKKLGASNRAVISPL